MNLKAKVCKLILVKTPAFHESRAFNKTNVED